MCFHTVYVHRYIVFTLKRACGISCLLYRHNSDLHMSLFKQIYNVSLAVDVKKKKNTLLLNMIQDFAESSNIDNPVWQQGWNMSTASNGFM